MQHKTGANQSHATAGQFQDRSNHEESVPSLNYHLLLTSPGRPRMIHFLGGSTRPKNTIEIIDEVLEILNDDADITLRGAVIHRHAHGSVPPDFWPSQWKGGDCSHSSAYDRLEAHIHWILILRLYLSVDTALFTLGTYPGADVGYEWISKCPPCFIISTWHRHHTCETQRVTWCFQKARAATSSDGHPNPF